METKLHDYQIKAIESIYNFFYTGANKGKMHLATGMGVGIVLALYVDKILQSKPDASILFLSALQIQHEQAKSVFAKYAPQVSVNSKLKVSAGITFAKYEDVISEKIGAKLSAFDLVICNDAHSVDKNYYGALPACEQAKYLAVLQANIALKGFFSDATFIYKYTISDALNEGHAFNWTCYMHMDLQT